MVAAIGTGEAFSKGRDFGAWLGLVPKQISTGDRTILGSISKRGNRYLRALFVQAAWVVLVKVGPKHWERYGLKSWIEAAKKRLHHNILAIALANKLARIAWSVLAHGRTFEANNENERWFRSGVVSDVDPVLVPLNKSLLVGHHSLGRASHSKSRPALVVRFPRLTPQNWIASISHYFPEFEREIPCYLSRS
jgi:Transposase IS116/IS110/IS902 family